MNLYFRMMRVLLRIFFEKKEDDPLSHFDIAFRVWPFDLDINMHMTNSRYPAWMDLGRIYMMGRTGLMGTSFKNGWFPVVGNVEIKFIRSIQPFAKVILRTEIHNVGEKYFDIRQTFLCGDKPVAIAHVKGLFLNKKKEKIPPAEILGSLDAK